MEQNERTLPVVEIAQLKFMVDATKMILIDTENPNNKLLVKDMANMVDFHSFVIDVRERKIDKEPGNTLKDPERYKRIYIPRMEALDPQGMRLQVDKGIAPAPQTHFETVNLLGTEYYFTANSSLQQVDNPWNIISKQNYEKDKGTIGFWYNQAERRSAFRNEIPLYAGHRPSADVTFIPLLDLLRNLRKPNHNLNEKAEIDREQKEKKHRGKGLSN